jgi:hypothetical protein
MQGGSAGNNTVAGNMIGTNSAGTGGVPNGGGVYVEHSNSTPESGNTIGPGNVISANNGTGIRILANYTHVVDNKIGTDITGNVDLGNASVGVHVTGTNNLIGLDDFAGRPHNVISGNGESGIYIDDTGGPAAANEVAHNYIGTNVAGSAAIPNFRGVAIRAAGGPFFNEVHENVISGNTETGVLVIGAASSNNLINRNTIGGVAPLGNGASGVWIDGAPNNSIGPYDVISGNGQHGVQITGETADGNKIRGTRIGTNEAGTAGVANAGDGIHIIDGDNTQIGGDPSADERNVISGHMNLLAHAGVWIEANSTSNLVRGNYIGSSADGTSAIGNAFGVVIFGHSNTIGGNGPVYGNLISGNHYHGVSIPGNSNIVSGNKIGTNASGTSSVGNGLGVSITGGFNNVDGRNVIAGNSFEGVLIRPTGLGPTPDSNTINDNYIGVNALGTPVPNLDGIIWQGGQFNSIFSNVIAHNVRYGAGGLGTARTQILANSIHSNGNLGIDLDNNGVTPNDSGDTDPGRQNYPVITSMVLTTSWEISLTGTPTVNHLLEAYSNTGCDPTGYGEGQELVGTYVSTDVDGSTVLTFTSSGFKDGEFATVTVQQEGMAFEGTSEFSRCFPVVDDADDDNDGYPDTAETACGANKWDAASLPERIDTPGDDDGDGAVNEALPAGSEAHDCDSDGMIGSTETSWFTHAQDPDSDNDGDLDGADNCKLWPNPSQALPNWSVPANDSDCDRFANNIETYLGTDPTLQCAANPGLNNEPLPDRWPADMNDNQVANTLDVGAFVFSLNSMNDQTPPDPRWNQRHDFNGNGLINTQDIGAFVFVLNRSCSPSGP